MIAFLRQIRQVCVYFCLIFDKLQQHNFAQLEKS